MKRLRQREWFELLYTGQMQAWQRLDSIWHRALWRAYRSDRTMVVDGSKTGVRHVITFLQRRLSRLREELEQRQRWYHEYTERLGAAGGEAARARVMLNFLRQLGASERALRGDAKAMRRQFGPDGVSERFDFQRARIEREVVFLLGRLGALLDRCWREDRPVDVETAHSRWRALELETVLLDFLAYPGDERLRLNVVQCLNTGCQSIVSWARTLLDRRILDVIYRYAVDTRQSVWLQAESLAVVAQWVSADLPTLALSRLQHPREGDDLFVRHRIVGLVARWLDDPATVRELMHLALQDCSPHVRQAVALALPQLPDATVKSLLPVMIEDRESCVPNAIYSVWEALASRADLQTDILQLVLAGLHPERSLSVLRASLHHGPRWFDFTLPEPVHAHARACEWWLPAIAQLQEQHPRTDVRRFAARAREQLWARDPARATLRAQLLPLALLPLGSTKRLQHPVFANHGALEIARLLQTLADGGFGFDLLQHRGTQLKVRREYRWAPRLWRLIAEWRRPASDKRQNYSHVRGRVYEGMTLVPSSQVAELSITKVPGEPLHLSEEGGYRPYLPLVDHAISALDQGWPARPVELVTSEGITEVLPPNGLIERLKAKWQLSWQFEKYARLRNWTSASTFKPETYVQALMELGFAIRIKPHPQTLASDDTKAPLVESRVARFFPAFVGLDQVGALFGEFREYFYSVYQNTLTQLLLFLGGMIGLFFSQHIWLNATFRNARKHIPFVVGGWGTRGKSGTERLKAAVFSGLGLQILSKTTGCEAMFLYGYPLRKTREMFLFRPYDKATIWEQVHLAKLARRLGTEVMLWECMGLNPRYVRILQHQWMRDDLSTITNCYPDHEDIQGPAGIDLPQVIGQFLPVRGVCATSEENMLPYLREIARRNQTPLYEVNWFEAGLIPPDVLARYPYEEHPYNIALVVKMFDTIGVAGDYGLKEMADRVVPDLGVLKAYPVTHIRGRRLEFVNGCSANERHGTLSNWVRMGFDQHRIDRDPKVWVSTVVNNRADRVARSQVFAGILVNDIGADRHYLIGGNLDGLQTYIENSFNAFADQLDWRAVNETEQATRREQFDNLLARWRIVRAGAEAQGRARAMLEGLGVTGQAWPESFDLAAPAALSMPESIDAEWRARVEAQWQSDCSDARAAIQLSERFAVGDNAALTTEIRSQLWQWFRARIIVVEDYYTTGNQLIDRVVSNTAPGLLGRVMGVQNIKGTGLDFVYRWQAWNDHHRWCKELLSDDGETAMAAAKALSASQELGLADEAMVRDTVAQAKLRRTFQTSALQSELQRIEQALDTQIGVIRASLGAASKSAAPTSRWEKFFAASVDWLEKLLDAGDAIWRRNEAQRVYEDLAHRRISLPRAVKILQTLTQRQKGGWLKQAIRRRREGLPAD